MPAAKPDASRKESEVGWPEFLPDGKHFLYMAIGLKPEDSTYRVGTLDSTETKPLAPAQTLVTYSPPGYLLFVRDKTLVAQPFDPNAFKTKGEPIPLAEHVGTDSVGLATLLGFPRRNARVPDRGVGSAPALGGSLGKGPRLRRRPRRVREPPPLPRRRPPRLRLERSPKREVRPLGPGSRAGRQFPLHVRRRQQRDPGLVPGREHDRVPVRPQRDLRSLREGGERPGGGEASLEERREQVRDRLVAGRAIHRLRVSEREDRLGPLGPADLRRPQADPDRREPVLGSGWPCSRPTRDLSRTSPTNRGAPRSTCSPSRSRAESGRSPAPAATDPSWRADGKEIYYRSADQKLMAVDIQAGETFKAGIPQAALPGQGPARRRPQQVPGHRPTGSASSSSRLSAATP